MGVTMLYSVAILILASFANAQEVDKASIGPRLEKGLKYLENNLNLDANGTFNIAIAAGQLIYLEKTAQTVTSEEANYISAWKQRIQVFINYQKQTYPNSYFVQTFLYPEDWVNNGDYRFVEGEMSGPKSEKSVTEIYGATLKHDEECKKELYSNAKSNEKRSCGISDRCMKVMKNTKEDKPVSPRERLIFLSWMNYLRCEEYPENYYEITKGLCNLLYKELWTLTEHGYVQNKAYFYMDTVLLCGTYGFAEFYNDDILETLMKQQNEDGSIGTQPKEEKKVLTAQYVAILSSAYRLNIAEIEEIGGE